MNLTIPRVIRGWKCNSNLNELPKTAPMPNGYGRRAFRYDFVENWQDAFTAFGLVPTSYESGYGHLMTNHFLDGAFTAEHKDYAPKEYAQIRCNFMLKKPFLGGNPIIEGEKILVEEGDLWICLASLEAHSSEPIQGGERVMFSFGGLVPIEQVNKILV
jgi:hypothetical protein